MIAAIAAIQQEVVVDWDDLAIELGALIAARKAGDPFLAFDQARFLPPDQIALHVGVGGFGARDGFSAVARERVERPRGTRHAGHPAEEPPDARDQDDRPPPVLFHVGGCLHPDRSSVAPLYGFLVGRRIHSRATH